MTKFRAAASPTAVTAALQGTPWRGDTPRRGLSASSCSDWDGPQLASLNHGCAERGVASLLGSGAPVAPGCCWQIRSRLTACVMHVSPIPSMSVVAYQGKLRCHFPSMGARIRDVSPNCRDRYVNVYRCARDLHVLSAQALRVLTPAHILL